MSPHWRPKLKIRSDERCRNFCCFRLSNVVLSMFRLWIFHYHQTWHRLADKNLKWTSRHRHSRRGLWSNPFSSSIPDFLLTVVCNIPSKLKGFQRIRRLTHSKLITTKLINDRSKLDFVAIAMWQQATLILWVWIDTDPKSSGDGRIKRYANVLETQMGMDCCSVPSVFLESPENNRGHVTCIWLDHFQVIWFP